MTPASAKTRRLLLVEDNPDDVFLFMRATNQEGKLLDVAVAGNAEEAIHALHDGGPRAEGVLLPDVVVTDIKMPGWTGIHLVSWVRSQPDFRHLPIIVLSSSQEPRDIVNAYEAGASYYMTKPSSFQGYRDLLRQLQDFCFDPSRPLHGAYVKTRDNVH